MKNFYPTPFCFMLAAMDIAEAAVDAATDLLLSPFIEAYCAREYAWVVAKINSPDYQA